MKVFIKTSEVGESTPRVVATYSDDSDVADDAHGAGITVLTLPASVLRYTKRPMLLPGKQPFTNRSFGAQMPTLAADWRERAGAMPVEAEAKHRIAAAFPPDEQTSALIDVINAIISYGTDVSKWPSAAQQLKAELDEKRRYIAEVKMRVQSHIQTLRHDPSNDKIWPPRPLKRP